MEVGETEEHEYDMLEILAPNSHAFECALTGSAHSISFQYSVCPKNGSSQYCGLLQ